MQCLASVLCTFQSRNIRVVYISLSTHYFLLANLKSVCHCLEARV